MRSWCIRPVPSVRRKKDNSSSLESSPFATAVFSTVKCVTADFSSPRCKSVPEIVPDIAFFPFMTGVPKQMAQYSFFMCFPAMRDVHFDAASFDFAVIKSPEVSLSRRWTR